MDLETRNQIDLLRQELDKLKKQIAYLDKGLGDAQRLINQLLDKAGLRGARFPVK